MDENKEEIKEAETKEKPEIDIVKERLDDAIKEISKRKRSCAFITIMAIIGMILLVSIFIVVDKGRVKEINECTKSFEAYNSTHTMEDKNIIENFESTYQAKEGDRIKIIPKLTPEFQNTDLKMAFICEYPFNKNCEWIANISEINSSVFQTNVFIVSEKYFDKKTIKFEVTG